MPKKYHIEVHEIPHRYPVIGRSGIIDWGEGCLKCPTCVKQECVYDVYRNRSFSDDIMADTIDELCKSCFRCVQGCPKRLIHKTINPEWEALGNDVYTPEIISATWEQARTGKIPVSGGGYGGPFSGPGFDSMWTDMSEIVRPTRDGIHGREYISTVVDIGRRPQRLKFDEKGELLPEPLPSIRVPLPILFDVLPFGALSPQVFEAVGRAASELGTRMVIHEDDARRLSASNRFSVPLLGSHGGDSKWVAGFEMVEVWDSADVLDRVSALKRTKPDLIVAVRIPATAANIGRVKELSATGVEVVHCIADERGYEPNVPNGAHIKDFVRELHRTLMDEHLRDEVTVIATGGIAMAEHVIKCMLCGANLVGVDIPLLVAMECRYCRNCVEGGECPVEMPGVDPEWGAGRIVNMIGAWHNQLLEMMGAMGIREARRLRGEQGRVMFMEDLEADTFGRLFG